MGLGSAAQLAHMLKITGDPVVFGVLVTVGSLNRIPNEVLGEGGVEIRGYRVTLDVDATDPKLVAVKNGSALTVAGVAYKVRQVGDAMPDGLRTLDLAEV